MAKNTKETKKHNGWLHAALVISLCLLLGWTGFIIYFAILAFNELKESNGK